MKRKPTEADILMWDQLTDPVLPTNPWTRKEWRFDSKRKWRFDFAVWNEKILLGIEIEGGAFTQGRHTRGKGFLADMEKYNHATLLGWRILRFPPKEVLNGNAIAFIKRVLES